MARAPESYGRGSGGAAGGPFGGGPSEQNVASFSARLRAGEFGTRHLVRRTPPRPGPELGTVRATLRPRGLVGADGVIVTAWWVGDGPPPAAGVRVRRRPDPGGCWLAEAVVGP
ncbi:hypothetical protein AB0A95_19430 [Micromonospora sp. NPDC049230]|uniref:hypothetical protein n=1 Tax=Micromonospora sp. NPDC049230 TaxID=3155502 RepID=UPI0033D6EAEC